MWRKGEAAVLFPGLSGFTGLSDSAERRGAEVEGAVEGRIEGIDGEGSLVFWAEGATEARAYAAGELRPAGMVDRRPPAL